jgi:hypothetical protein
MENVISFISVIQGWVPFVVDVVGVKDDISWGLETVKKMVAENRGPTDEEWDEVNRRTDALQAKLHSDA